MIIFYWQESLTQLNMKQNKKKEVFLPMLLPNVGTSLLGSLLSGKGIVRASEGILRAGDGSSIKKSLTFTTSFHKF